MQIDELLDQLKARYSEAGYGDCWSSEGPGLEKMLAGFSAKYGDLYTFEGALKPGGSGVPLLAAFVPLGNERQVLKFPRPTHTAGADLNKILADETEKLQAVRHQNIIRITFQGRVDDEVPFYAMEYLEGVKDADVYLETIASPDKLTESLVRIVRGSISGLSCLHRNGIVHLDIKPSNLFVDATGHVVVADFGFAKNIAREGVTATIGGTDGYMHPDYARLMKNLNDKNKHLGGPIERSSLRPIWDLFSLGITFTNLLRAVNKRDPAGSADYERQYIRAMAYRMLDGCFHSLTDHGPYGLPNKVFSETRYTDIAEAEQDLHKLDGTYNLSARVPEVSRYQRNTIQAASHSIVPFTKRVQRLIDSREVRSLGHLPQLGMTQFVYATASHSRLEHSLGTFGMVCGYVRSLYNDPSSPIFRQIVTERDIEALLVASLTHDVGHYPLAHDLEEVSIDVFSHTNRTRVILENPDSDLSRAITASEPNLGNACWHIRPADVVAILSKDKRDVRSQVLHSILDCPIDADKLDYLIRDSENLRLTYGAGIDVERLIHSLTVVIRPRGGSGDDVTAGIGIYEKGKIAAESVAFARYAMYGCVYWHHTHRAAKAMLNAIGYEALANVTRGASDDASKERALRSLRDQLYRFLDHAPDSQGVLPIPDDSADRDFSDFLNVDHQRMIMWLDDRGGHRAEGLAQLLIRRKLFKRALVVSRVRADVLPWKKIEYVYGELGKHWEQKRRINQLLQDAVVQRICESMGDGQTPPALLESHVPLVLVDYPPDKGGVGAVAGLEYVKEGTLQTTEGIDTDVEDLEQSLVWRSLRNDSRESLAKLRVFCHPDLLALIVSVLDRSQFETILREVLAKS